MNGFNSIVESTFRLKWNAFPCRYRKLYLNDVKEHHREHIIMQSYTVCVMRNINDRKLKNSQTHEHKQFQ